MVGLKKGGAGIAGIAVEYHRVQRRFILTHARKRKRQFFLFRPLRFQLFINDGLIPPRSVRERFPSRNPSVLSEQRNNVRILVKRSFLTIYDPAKLALFKRRL